MVVVQAVVCFQIPSSEQNIVEVGVIVSSSAAVVSTIVEEGMIVSSSAAVVSTIAVSI